MEKNCDEELLDVQEVDERSVNDEENGGPEDSACNEELDEEGSDESCSDEDMKPDEVVSEAGRNVSQDALLSHIDEQFEGIDLDSKPEPKKAFEPPSEETINNIVFQVEYYFSDANIVQDDFLLKHIKRNKKGYVSLKLIAAFNKMKKLVNDYRIIGYAIEKSSTKLVLSASKKKIRRSDPLPIIVPKPFSDMKRVVIATYLRSHDFENIEGLFSPCGAVTKIEVVESQTKLPDVVKSSLAHQKRNFSMPLVLVEYGDAVSAQRASEILTNKEDWRTGIRVEKLTKFCKKPINKDKENKTNDDQNPGANAESKKKQQKKVKKKKKSQANRCPVAEQTLYPAGDTQIGIPIPEGQRGIPNASPKQSPFLATSPRTFGSRLPAQGTEWIDNWRVRSNSFGPSNSSPRWLQKRQLESSGASGSATSLGKDDGKTESAQVKGVPLGVSRLPKGPDGSKGFGVQRTIS